MTTLLIVFAAIIAVFLGYTLVAPTLSYLPQFSRAVEVHCPYLKTSGRVRLKALPAALAAGYGLRNLHVKACTLLAGRVNCDQGCLEHKE